MIILRFGPLMLFGIGFIIWALRQKKHRKEIFNSPDFIKANAIVKGVEMGFQSNSSLIIWRVKAKYKTNSEKEIVSLSKNTIHSSDDYQINDKMEIIYNKNNPKIFYLLDDKGNAKTGDFILLCMGTLITAIGIILMIIYK